jgi:predicted RNase H-like HicB family nuclease
MVVEASRGKGGHQMVRIAEKWTTVQTGELKPGVFHDDAKATRHPEGRVLNMQTWAFPAVIEKLGDDDFLATFPDVPEARTGGASLAEVRENAADALEEAILAYLAHGRPIPNPREPRGGEQAIILDPVTAARAALATAMRT